MADLPRAAATERRSEVRLVPVTSLHRLHELLCLAVVLQALDLLLTLWR